MKRLTFSFISLMLCFGLFAQEEELTFKQVDTTSYIAWKNQDWKKIIDIGNKAISDSIDYFYLRIRMGIAFYENRQYDEAIPHFQKALEFNSADETAIEYLYYSLLFSGKVRGAGFYAKYFPQELIDKIKPSIPKTIDKIELATSFSIYPDFQTNKNDITGLLHINYRLEKDLSGPLKSIGIALHHEFSQKTSLFYDFHLLESTNFQQLYYNFEINHQSEYKLKQYQLYISPTFYWKNNRSFNPFVHILYLQADNYKYKYMKVDTIIQPPQLPRPVYIYAPVKENKISKLQFIAGFNYAVSRKLSVLDFSITASNLNDSIQFELTPGYTFYFNSKKSIFSRTTITLHSQKPDFHLIFNQSFGVRLLPTTWFELSGSYGNKYNFNENNGYSVYNTSDITLYSVGAKLSFPIIKKLSFYLSYTLSEKENNLVFLKFNGFNNRGVAIFKPDIKEIKYQQQLIYGGIIWKF